PSNPRLHSLARGQAWFFDSYDLERMIWSRTRPSQSDGGVIPNSLRSVGARSRSPASSLTPGLIFGPAIPQNPSRLGIDEKCGQELQSSGAASRGLTWIFSVVVKGLA